METDLASKEQVWIGILDYKTVIFFPRTPFKKEYQSIYWPVNLGKKNKDESYAKKTEGEVQFKQ